MYALVTVVQTCALPILADPAVGQRAVAIVRGFLLEFSRRDDVRHAVQLLLDHQADRLSIRNDGVALLRAVQSPALCLDGRDQLVENGTGALPRRRRHKQAELAFAAEHRSEEHQSELQSLMRNSYAVFCLKKK